MSKIGPPNVRFNIAALKDNRKAEEFQLKLSNRFDALACNVDTNNVEQLSEQIVSEILSSAKDIIPPERKSVPDWMSKETKQAINDKKSVRKSFGENSKEYKIAKAETKKLVKKDKISKLERDCNE